MMLSKFRCAILSGPVPAEARLASEGGYRIAAVQRPSKA